MSSKNLTVKLKHMTPFALKEAAKKAVGLVDPVFIRFYQANHPPPQPIPPIRMRSRVGSANIQRFIEGGKNCATALEGALQNIGCSLDDFDSILDFGCGCGRVIQHFYSEERRTKLHGCDVDYIAIEWMNRNYPRSDFRANNYSPPLPFDAESFDLLYSVSIFTHLPETKQRAWLEEIKRVLKPGGITLLTIQSAHALRMFAGEQLPLTASCLHRIQNAQEQQKLEKEGLVYEPYEYFSPDSPAFPGIDETYGITFQSHDYIHANWSVGFEILGMETGTVDSLQDVVILRKRSDKTVRMGETLIPP